MLDNQFEAARHLDQKAQRWFVHYRIDVGDLEVVMTIHNPTPIFTRLLQRSQIFRERDVLNVTINNVFVIVLLGNECCERNLVEQFNGAIQHTLVCTWISNLLRVRFVMSTVSDVGVRQGMNCDFRISISKDIWDGLIIREVIIGAPNKVWRVSRTKEWHFVMGVVSYELDI